MSKYKALTDLIFLHRWSYILAIISLLLVDLLQLSIPEILRSVTDKLQNNILNKTELLHYALYFIAIDIGIAFLPFFVFCREC